jgi:two-component system sensor histidine kinase MprB
VSLRWKIALACAGVALVATASVGIVSYRSTAQRLLTEVDRSIDLAIPQVLTAARTGDVPAQSVLSMFSARMLSDDGRVLQSTFPVDVPVDPALAAVYDDPRAYVRSTESADGEHLRILTIGLRRGAVQIARSLDETDRVLDDLRRRTALIVVIVSVSAAAIGWVIASGVAAPLRRLTRAAEDVGATGELDVEVQGHGNDEVGRLAAAFREMLDALSRSRVAQQRLVDDAGHELRTPLTSLRTNLSVLRRHGDLSDETRAAILGDLDEEVIELSVLVDELVAVAGGEQPTEPARPVALEPLAREVAARVGRRRGRRVVVSATAPATVVAEPSSLDRAVTNLVDNACKFDATGGPIEISVEGGSVRVLDRGPGIETDDLDHVFDRFYRADSARTMPGSGLGLSMVAEMAERNGGSVFAAARDGGGAEVGFRLPIADDSTLDPDRAFLPPLADDSTADVDQAFRLPIADDSTLDPDRAFLPPLADDSAPDVDQAFLPPRADDSTLDPDGA